MVAQKITLSRSASSNPGKRIGSCHYVDRPVSSSAVDRYVRDRLSRLFRSGLQRPCLCDLACDRWCPVTGGKCPEPGSDMHHLEAAAAGPSECVGDAAFVGSTDHTLEPGVREIEDSLGVAFHCYPSAAHLVGGCGSCP